MALAVAAMLQSARPALAAGDELATALDGMPLARVILHTPAHVTTDVIRLGEIATVETADARLAGQLEALEVGRAALPGESRTISVASLRLRMRQAKLPERSIEIVAERESIEVITRYQVVSKKDLEAAIARWYAVNATLPAGAELRLDVDVAEQWVPMGAVEIGVGLAEARFGNVAAPLEIRVDGRPYKRINATVKAYVEQPVWVATRTLSRGETLAAGDVTLATRLLTQPVSGPADLERPLRATRYVREGTPLTWDVVEPVPDVHKGELVTVVASLGGILVQVAGEAVSDGRVGEMLAVRNVESGNIVYGTLTAGGLVLVPAQ